MFFLDLLAIIYFVLLLPIPVFFLVFHGWLPLWRQFGYGVYLLVSAAYLIIISVTFSSLETLILTRSIPESSWVWAGFALILMGFALEVTSAYHLSLASLLGIPKFVPKKKGKLVTTGIYAYSRHPLYLSYMIMALGFAVSTGMKVMWFLFFWSVGGLLWAALVEEKDLSTRFGSAYRRYTKRTDMFIPKIW